VFSKEATVAILVLQNNQMASMLVYQTNPVGVELFLFKQFLLFQQIWMAAGHMSESAL